MVLKLEPYPSYKDSAVEWLGKVPEHWVERRLKTAVNHINEQTSIKSDEDLYIALEHIESWTGRLLLPSGEAQFDSQVKRFRAGDVLFAKLRPYLAKVARPEQGGVCVGEFFVLRARPIVIPHYLEVVLRSAPAIDFVNSSTYGAKMPRADWTFVGAMLFPLPTLPEQTAIVRFLDWADARIRKAIHARKRRIKLLVEYKQALIQQAVTGQIDVRTGKPYPKYKDSGAEWLGKVPEHWKVLPGRTVFREINDRGHTVEQMLSVTITRGVLHQVNLLADSSKKDSSNEDKSKYKLVQPDDLVYNKMRAWQGAVGVSPYRGIVSPAYIVQRLRSEENLPLYMHFLLRTSLFASEAERWSYGITSDQWSLRAEQFKCIYFSLPPLPEQTAIVEYLEVETAKFDAAIATTRRSIELLEEYRTRLIAEVVTGKLDVREAAASLPAESLEELQNMDEALNLEEQSNDGDLSDAESDETAEEDAYAD